MRAPTTPVHSFGSKFNLSRGEHAVCNVMTFPLFSSVLPAEADAAATFSAALLLSSSTLFSISSKALWLSGPSFSLSSAFSLTSSSSASFTSSSSSSFGRKLSWSSAGGFGSSSRTVSCSFFFKVFFSTATPSTTLGVLVVFTPVVVAFLPPKPRKEVVDVVLRPYALLARAELAPTPSFVRTKRFTNDAGEEEPEEEETSANNPPTHANATVAAVLIVVVLFFLLKVVPNIFVASSSFSTSKSSFSSSIKGCRSKS